MSLKPTPIGNIPAETKAIAQAIFPKGNGYMRMRDELGTFTRTRILQPCIPA